MSDAPHVAQISFFLDRTGRSPTQLLKAWTTLVDVAEATHRAGLRVSVVQACTETTTLDLEGVQYHFAPFGTAATAPSGEALLYELLRQLRPDVLHVHGLAFPRDVRRLVALAPAVPIVLQDHADKPPRIWRRALWRGGLAVADGLAFCARDQARPFADAGLLGLHTHLYEIPESTSRFVPGDHEEARRLTGIVGDPAVLWVGHLDPNKDPLTVLDGISAASRALRGLRLYCCFGTAPLLRSVQDRISADPHLRDRVRLLGRVPHDTVELLMRAADLFVLGSHREGSGYSLIEALACGLPPVVTDIPSFRSLTGGGAVGRLYPCDDPLALCEALHSIAGRMDAALRASVRAHFDRELSSRALGVKLRALYHDVLERRRRVGTSADQPGVRPASPTISGIIARSPAESPGSAHNT